MRVTSCVGWVGRMGKHWFYQQNARRVHTIVHVKCGYGQRSLGNNTCMKQSSQPIECIALIKANHEARVCQHADMTLKP